MPVSTTFERRHLEFEAEGTDGFGAYHDLYSGGSTVSRHGREFRSAVTAYRFPRLLMFDRQIAGAAHHRDEARVRRDGFDHFTLQVLRAGRMAAGAPGDETAMEAGDVAVFDTTRPHRTVVEGADYVTVTLPRDVVQAALPDARGLHGRVLPRAAAGLLGDFLLSLVRHAPTIGPDLAARGSGIVAGLLAGVAGDAGPPGAEAEAADEALALHRARGEAFIEAHLGDPALDADRVAASLGLSRSTLYRAFAPVDGVARQITLRRLERLRAALRRPAEVRSVAALGFELGFASESHCGRAFKAAFGVTPGQYRADARRSRGTRDAAARAGKLSEWFSELY